MKLFILIISIINLCLIPGYGSVLLSIENGGHKYFVSLWKHTEDSPTDDEVPMQHKFYGEKQLAEIDGMLSNKKGLKVVFNKGTFTSMNYMAGETLRWVNLSQAEKDMIFYLQNKFDVTDKK